MRSSIAILALALLTPSTASARGKPNQWYSKVEKDAFTDKVEAFAAKTAADTPTWKGPERIIMRCSNGKFDLYVTSNDYLDPDRTRTRVRFDDEDPITVSVSRAESGDALFLVGRQKPTVIQKMRTGSKMVVEVEPWRERPRPITFSLAGMTKHLNILAKHCPEAAGGPPPKGDPEEQGNTSLLADLKRAAEKGEDPPKAILEVLDDRRDLMSADQLLLYAELLFHFGLKDDANEVYQLRSAKTGETTEGDEPTKGPSRAPILE